MTLITRLGAGALCVTAAIAVAGCGAVRQPASPGATGRGPQAASSPVAGRAPANIAGAPLSTPAVAAPSAGDVDRQLQNIDNQLSTVDGQTISAGAGLDTTEGDPAQ